MKRSFLYLAFLSLPLAASAQSGTVNIDEVFTVRSVSESGLRLVVHSDKTKKPGDTCEAELRATTQVLGRDNRPLKADRLKPGWHIEIRGNRTAARLIKADVVIVKKD